MARAAKLNSMLKLSKFILIGFLCLLLVAALSAQTKTRKIDGAGLKSLLPDKENKKPLLINFWATWCGPCRVEFPELVKIDADYREKGLNFALVSVDKFALIDTRVPEFLQEYEAAMPSYLINYPTRREIAKAVRQIAPGFIDRYPTTLLFDANGKLVYQKAGVISGKILRAEIDKVLPKKK